MLEWGLVRSGLPAIVGRAGRPSVVILAYHNVLPDGAGLAGERSLHLDQSDFAAQLDMICETHDVVPLASALDPAPTGRPRVVITFDDAYLGAVTSGFHELAKRSLPASMFVPAGMLGGEGFWWDRLSDPEGSLDPEVRDRCLVALGGRQYAILDWAVGAGLAVHVMPEHCRPADEATLRRESEAARITIGSHTWSHPNLAALRPSEAVGEVNRARQWLRSRFAAYVDYVAYPYGFSQDGVLGTDVDRAEAGLLIAGGPALLRGRRTSGPDRIPRVNIPRGMSLDGLALRLAGLRR